MPIGVARINAKIKKTKKTINIGRKICDVTGEKRSTSYLLQSISIANQRGNATSVMGTFYNDRNLEEIYKYNLNLSYLDQF